MVPSDMDRSEFMDGYESELCPSSGSSGQAGRPELVNEAKRPMVGAVPMPAGTGPRSRGHDFRVNAE